MSGTVIAGLNWLDIVLISIIVFSVFIGLARGLVKTVISIVTWLAAAYFAYRYAGEFTHFLESFISNTDVRLWVTRIGVFVVVMIVGAIIGNVIYQLIAVGGMRGFDRVLGMVFGIVMGVVIASTLILASGFTNFPDSELFKTSALVPQLMEFVNYLREFLPEDINQKIHFPSDSVVPDSSSLSGGKPIAGSSTL